VAIAGIHARTITVAVYDMRDSSGDVGNLSAGEARASMKRRASLPSPGSTVSFVHTEWKSTRVEISFPTLFEMGGMCIWRGIDTA
jgi:hypothetical protein